MGATGHDNTATGPRPFSAGALVLAAERAEWAQRRRELAAQGRRPQDPPRLVDGLDIVQRDRIADRLAAVVAAARGERVGRGVA